LHFRQSADGPAVVPLLFRSPGRRRSRVSAEKERSAAENFLQKQQKQQEPFEERPVAGDLWTRALALTIRAVAAG